MVQGDCHFSIKGGGHSSNVGASSITGGFQFDLAKLREFKISDDKKSVTVGPGWRWGELLQQLEPLGVIVVGGRDAGVGVPGFVFGGTYSIAWMTNVSIANHQPGQAVYHITQPFMAGA